MNDCHVIILMGTYNGERYVDEQIQSIQSQSYENWQLLVRDDGSTDNTVRVLNTFQAQDDRIETLVDNKGNLGASGNFNQLCLAALKRHADVILFCDQDDVWLPDKIETQIQAIRSLEQQHGKEYPVLVYTDLSVVDARLKTMHHSFLAYQGVKNIDAEPLRVLLAQNYIPACASASNRTLLQLATPIPDEALMHDWWFALCAAACGKIEFIPESMSRYRQHRDNAVGAKGLLGAISPFHGNMKTRWQTGNTNFRRSIGQAQQLRKRIQDRKPGLHRESLSRINAYADCFEKGRVERIRSILKQGIKRQGIIYGTLFYLLLLISSGGQAEESKVRR